MSIQLGYNNVASGSGTTLIAGQTIPANSLVQLGPDGRGYPAQVSDYAAVGQSKTTVLSTSDYSLTSASKPIYNGSLMLQSSDGSIVYLLNPGNYLVSLQTVTASGTNPSLSGTGFIYDFTGMTGPNIFFTNNGDGFSLFPQMITVVGGVYYSSNQAATPPDGYIITMDSQTHRAWSAKPFSSVGCPSAYTGQTITSMPLAGGTVIALLYISTSGSLILAGVTSDLGGLVFSVVVDAVGTPSTTNPPYNAMVQLSNSNIAIAWLSGGVYKIAIYDSTNGTVQKAAFSTGITPYSPSGSPTPPPLLNAMNGFFAMVTENNSEEVCYLVYNNAGTSITANNSISGLSSAWYNIVNDGSNFWVPFGATQGNYIQFAKVPTDGTAASVVVTYPFTLPSTAISYWNGIAYDSGTGTISVLIGSYWLTFSPSLQRVISTGVLAGSLTNTSQIIVSDGVMIVPGTDTSNVSNPAALTMVKTVDTAILGASQAGASAGNPVYIKTASGSQPINPLMGSVIKSFDHSNGNIYGNKGSIVGSAVSLKGL